MEEDEARLFYKVQDRSDERETIRLVPLGEQIGLHPIRIRELARKWKNQGLVGFADPNMVWLTSKGEELGKSEMQEL